MTSARDVLDGRRCVLLDFDGPVCAIFGGHGARAIGDQLAVFIEGMGVRIPKALAGTSDPFALLRLAATISQDVLVKADTEFRRLELAAVPTARQTDGLTEVLQSFTEEGRSVAIVSNNSAQAVRGYLEAHQLNIFISTVAARDTPDVRLLKPSAHLLQEAIRTLAVAPGDCVMIGDSPSDIEAARAVGVAVIAFANKPAKRRRLAALHPDAVVEHMADLLATDERT